jgi:hypothetical protein
VLSQVKPYLVQLTICWPKSEVRENVKDPSCTRQSPLTLATFRSWGSSQDGAT